MMMKTEQGVGDFKFRDVQLIVDRKDGGRIIRWLMPPDDASVFFQEKSVQRKRGKNHELHGTNEKV